MLGLAAHPLPWLRISLRSRPRSSRRASCADPKHRAGAGEAPSSRRRAPAVHLRADGNEHVSRGKNACAPMDSSSTAVAHRDGRLHQRPGGTPMRARAPNSFVPTSGAIGHGHGGDSLAACCALALSAHFAPGCRLTHVLRTPFERHRLAIRQGYQRGTASGRIGHHYQCRRLRRNRCSKVGPASRKWTGRRGGRQYWRQVPAAGWPNRSPPPRRPVGR